MTTRSPCAERPLPRQGTWSAIAVPKAAPREGRPTLRASRRAQLFCPHIPPTRRRGFITSCASATNEPVEPLMRRGPTDEPRRSLGAGGGVRTPSSGSWSAPGCCSDAPPARCWLCCWLLASAAVAMLPLRQGGVAVVGTVPARPHRPHTGSSPRCPPPYRHTETRRARPRRTGPSAPGTSAPEWGLWAVGASPPASPA